MKPEVIQPSTKHLERQIEILREVFQVFERVRGESVNLDEFYHYARLSGRDYGREEIVSTLSILHAPPFDIVAKVGDKYELRLPVDEIKKSAAILFEALSIGKGIGGPIRGPHPPPDERIVDIKLSNIHTPRKFALIPLPKDKRAFFPGFKMDFVLETDAGEITTRVTSAPKGTPQGDPDAGAYIQGNLRPWYAKHQELRQGDILRIEAVEPYKRYRLSVIRS